MQDYHGSTLNTCLLRADGSSPLLVTYEDVGRVLGIPYSGLDVPIQLPEKELNSMAKSRNISLKDLTSTTMSQEPGLDYWRSVLAFFLLLFLCSITKDACSILLVPAISIAAEAKKYNWAKFVLQWLVEEIQKCNDVKRTGKSTAQSMGIGRCVTFLLRGFG